MDGNDWRLTNQAEELGRRAFRWAEWTPFKPGWDHDHCAFCWTEFAAVASEHAPLTAGWVTADDDREWVCAPCMEDFRDPLDLRIMDA